MMQTWHAPSIELNGAVSDLLCRYQTAICQIYCDINTVRKRHASGDVSQFM